jgi:NitT/TauT family transport system substrate-binding protein
MNLENRRILAACTLVLLLSLACGGSAAQPQASATPVKLTVGYSNLSGDFVPLWVAAEANLFKKNGLDVELVYLEGGSKTMSTMLSNQADVIQLGGSEVLSAVAAGADVVVLATLAPVYPYLFMVQANIKTAADLKGKKVGVSSIGGSADIATRVALPKLGIDPDKDVTIIPVASHANRTTALLNNAIQGGVDDPPDSVELEKKGLHALFDLAALKLPAAQTVTAVQRSWLKANKSVAQKYIDALVEAIAKERSDRAFTIKAMKKYFKSEDDHAMNVAYDFFTKEVTPSRPYPKAEQFKQAQETLAKRNQKVAQLDLDKILDPSFVKSASDRGLAGKAA